MFSAVIDRIGLTTLHICNRIGATVVFLFRTIHTACTTRIKLASTIQQMHFVGVKSLSIVILTGLFSGLALALQSYIGFSRVGAEDFIGLVVTLGMTRELAPVLTGLMTAGRAGSAMTAEIGTMRISEQIDALKTLRINPLQYLVVPRLVASTIILPFLTIFAMVCGVIGAYTFCINVLGLSSETFFSTIEEGVAIADIIGGLFKSACFGFLSAWIGTYNGYHTRGGARGVGSATTETVVTGSILVLIANYILSAILFQTGIG